MLKARSSFRFASETCEYDNGIFWRAQGRGRDFPLSEKSEFFRVFVVLCGIFEIDGRFGAKGLMDSEGRTYVCASRFFICVCVCASAGDMIYFAESP